MEKQLSDMNIVELKALAYDCMAQMEFLQNNLKAINQELSKKIQAQQQIQPFAPGSIKPS